MFCPKYQRVVCALALAGALGWGGFPVHADGRDNESKDRRDDDQRVKTVFVIAMENHNWTQPSTLTSPQQIFSESSCAVHQQLGPAALRGSAEKWPTRTCT